MLKHFCSLIILFFLALDTSSAEMPSTSPCLDGKMSALKQGGFSGPLLCDGKGVTFRFVGKLNADTTYLIYDYRYRFKPVDGMVYHGGQKLIVFDITGKYLGQYALTPPPNFELTVVGDQVKVRVKGVYKGAIEFIGGPAPNAHIDDEKIMFYK